MENTPLARVLLDWSTTFIRLAMHDLNRFARDAGLSLPQVNVLVHLFYTGPGEVTRLCELMQVSPAAASQMIERMVQQGVVERGESPGDRRVRLVRLTAAGRAVVEQIITARRAWIEELIAPLPESERGEIAAALLRLNERAGGLEIHPFNKAAPPDPTLGPGQKT